MANEVEWKCTFCQEYSRTIELREVDIQVSSLFFCHYFSSNNGAVCVKIPHYVSIPRQRQLPLQL